MDVGTPNASTRSAIISDHRVVGLIDRVVAGVENGIGAARRRWGPVDHLWRAVVRYDDVNASRLAAANAYYGFFAVLALAVIAFVVLGQVLRTNATVIETVSLYLSRNLPQLETEQIIENSRRAGIIAVIGLVLAGVFWVETLRSSQRALWKLDQQPGNVIIRWLVDLGVLVGLGILLMASLAVSAGLQDFVLRLVGEPEESPVRAGLRAFDTLIAGAVDLILGAALLAGVPRLHMSLRRLLPPALLFAVGLFLLKTLGKWYITRTENNPAYQLVAGTVGVLLFMFLLHQLLLFAAALAATSTRGTVRDLAGGERPPDVVAIAVAAEHAAGSLEQAAEAAERAATAARELAAERSGPGAPGLAVERSAPEDAMSPRRHAS